MKKQTKRQRRIAQKCSRTLSPSDMESEAIHRRSILFGKWKLEDALVVAKQEAKQEGIVIGIERGKARRREEEQAWFLDLLDQGLSVEEIKRRLAEE